MNEIIEKRTKYAKHFDLGGGKRQAVITKHPQHFQKDGQWQDIRNDWVFEKGFGQKMQQAEHHLRLFNDGKEKLRFGFDKGVYVDYELPAALGVATRDAAKSGAWVNADLKYTATPEGIKGEIILQAAGHPVSFSFPLSATGCAPAVEGNALVYYADGKPVGRINAPYMEDAKGEIGVVALTYDAGVVTFTPDAKWLESAAYPVAIDPTTTIQPDADAGKDAYIYSYLRDNNYGSNPTLPVGTDTTSGRFFRSLVQFDLSGLPSGATINSAELQLYIDHAIVATGYNALAHKITEAWVEAEVTWNTQPGFDATPIDTVSVSTVGWYAWDIQSLVAAWNSGTVTNNGLLMKLSDEVSVNTRKYARSSDYTTDTSLHPKLVIEYTEPITAEGGSESTITVTTEGAGTKIGIGASEADTIVTVTGAGTKEGIAPTSEPPVTVTTEGAGAKATSGPATPSEVAVTVAAEGAGSKVAIGPDAEAAVTVTAEGAGVKAASGASETVVTVGVESGGEAYFVMPPEITIEQVGSVIRLSW